MQTNLYIEDLPGGRLQVQNYSFTFHKESISLFQLADDGQQSFGIPNKNKESSKSILERASRMKYSVSTNMIYQMATNWLVAFDIDLNKLEKLNPPCVNKYPDFHSDRGLVPSPLLVVDWKNTNTFGYDHTEVSVEISAVSGDLLEIQVGMNSFTKRNKPMIKDLDKLLAIPDEEFLKFSEAERTNLFARFANLPSQAIPGMPNLSRWFVRTKSLAGTNTSAPP